MCLKVSQDSRIVDVQAQQNIETTEDMPLQKKSHYARASSERNAAEKQLLPQFSFEQRPRSAPILGLESAYRAILRHNSSRLFTSMTAETYHESHDQEADITDQDGANVDADLVSERYPRF